VAQFRLNQKLLQRLADKLGKPTKYIREQIRKKASKYQVSSEAYFVYWLTDEKIGAERYRRALLPEIQEEIRTLQTVLDIRKKPPLRSFKGTSVRKIEKILQIKKLKIKVKPNILLQMLIIQALENSELYPVLFIFENSLRNLINLVLTKKYGLGWWKNMVSKKIKDRVVKRMQEEKLNPWRGSRGIEPLFYTDFSDLATILRRNAVDFEPLFTGIIGGLNFLTRRLDELEGIRHNIAHTNPLKAKDRDLLHIYFENFYDLLDILNKKVNSI